MYIFPLIDSYDSNGSNRILLVEDNAQTQLIINFYLKERYTVDITSTAEEGIEFLKKKSYSLIILDINLPGKLDGNSLLDYMMNDRVLRNVPVLVVTAYGLKGDKEKYLSRGAKGYLPKPVNKANLIYSIDTQISGYR